MSAILFTVVDVPCSDTPLLTDADEDEDDIGIMLVVRNLTVCCWERRHTISGMYMTTVSLLRPVCIPYPAHGESEFNSKCVTVREVDRGISKQSHYEWLSLVVAAAMCIDVNPIEAHPNMYSTLNVQLVRKARTSIA